jgi:hypothetical protein
MKDGDAEGPAQIAGSIGHAILADRVRARWVNEIATPWIAAQCEAEKREWSPGWRTYYDRANHAANLLADALRLDHIAVAPNLYTGEGGPLCEVRVKAEWSAVRKIIRIADEGTFSPRYDCEAVFSRFAGMEGAMDIVTFPNGPADPAAIIDYKFRTKPDLGGAATPTVTPGRQSSWYLTLLRALGFRPAGGVEFWEANVYAGEYLTRDQIITAGRMPHSATQTASAFIVKGGLPSCDLSRYSDAGYMITAEDWAEAHRVLANERHTRRVSDWRFAGGKGKCPDLLTTHEREQANKFIADLCAWKPVEIRKVRADPAVCAEVVRDLIVGVEGPLAVSLRGLSPARHLQSHPKGPCERRYGCPIQDPCKASLGTGDVLVALRHSAEVAREAQAAARQVEEAYA